MPQGKRKVQRTVPRCIPGAQHGALGVRGEGVGQEAQGVRIALLRCSVQGRPAKPIALGQEGEA